MDGWRPQNTGEWIGKTQRTLDQLDRRTPKRGSWGNVVLTAVGQSGGHVIDSNGTVFGPYPIANGYIPNLGDEVILNASGSGGYTIMGAKGDWSPLPRKKAGIYRAYINNNPGENTWSLPRIGLRHGIVQISGLAALLSAPTDTTLFVLDPPYRPDFVLIVPVSNSDIMRGLTILPTGEVQIRAGFTTAGFVSFESVMYPAAGVADWTFIDPAGTVGSTHAFQGTWSDLVPGGGGYGRARYWIDDFGVMWTGGVVKASAGITDNDPIFTTPITFPLEQHVRAVSAEHMGGIHVGAASHKTTVNTKSPNSNTWVSLDTGTFITPAAFSLGEWEYATDDFVLGGGWTQYPPTTQFQKVAKWLRPDGIGFLTGLMNNGTVGATTLLMSARDELAQGQLRSRLFPTFSNSAFGRLDLRGMHDAAWGSWIPTGGSNLWMSLDGIKWIAG